MLPESPSRKPTIETELRNPAAAASPNIPDHQLLRCIGRGSYGEVWIARSVTGPYRAVKLVHRRSFGAQRPYEREFEGLQRFEPISRTHDRHANRSASYSPDE